ncbi:MULTISPECIES: hypothetical protein [Clostridium]|uniref:Uncharacterized protein n=2 Tax=Clostridium TaxID=1485 RepID=A0Q0T9_CLONN|nr:MULTISPECIES: hypothetical protein [Clostridium]KEH96845.1 hypothetical protein Z962_05610 [Clostridium botulinum C/D str. BKT12695]ABK60369.1 conserved hypothetical protein [Clostridium novyi NT]KEH84950.1 hypothetical protein Z965_11250 [Clostridium novyi A str. BKT29909]KEH85041.1 hypothetical protein Z965_11155 [Clostridium novyi A str. BKT29909]KEH88613.1 hypothetical protein Z966_00345 [Clostridium novyi A str. NCTC 538]
MSVQRTGYTKSTPQHYWVDAGAIYDNLTFNKETKTWEGGKPIGATADGNKITFEQEYRQIEVDGVFVPAVGQKVLKSASAKLEVNVKEITPENIRKSINGIIRKDENYEGYSIIESKAQLEDSDYIPHLYLVGTITGSKQPIIVEFDNCLCISGLNVETKDDDEAVIKMEFEAHASAEQVANRKIPARFYAPDTGEEISIQKLTGKKEE